MRTSRGTGALLSAGPVGSATSDCWLPENALKISPVSRFSDVKFAEGYFSNVELGDPRIFFPVKTFD
jgi:hypothetical protein